MATVMPNLLVQESVEAAWALDDPKSIAGRVTRAREEGYVNLTPFQRQFAMEFVLSGTSLKKIAALMELPRPFIQRMYNDPVVRAYISDLQKECAAHRLINDQWVENQLLNNWPKLMGEEAVDIVTSKGCHVKAKKYHASEVGAMLRHFGATRDEGPKGNSGVNVQINFADIFSRPEDRVPQVTIDLGDHDRESSKASHDDVAIKASHDDA